MFKQAPLLIFVLLLLACPALAQDFNAMTGEEIQAMINQQVADAIAAQPQQPTVITTQLDEDTRQTIDRLNNQINDLKASIENLNLRFAQMSEHLDVQLASATKDGKTHTTREIERVIAEERVIAQAYIKEVTNPVRMNLPSIATFGVLTAIFLLWISRYYRPKGASE